MLAFNAAPSHTSFAVCVSACLALFCFVLFSQKNSAEQSVPFKNAVVFCHRYEKKSVSAVSNLRMPRISKQAPLRGWIVLCMNMEMSVPQARNQLLAHSPAPSGEGGKSPQVSSVFAAGPASRGRRRGSSSAWLSCCARNMPAGWKRRPRPKSQASHQSRARMVAPQPCNPEVVCQGLAPSRALCRGPIAWISQTGPCSYPVPSSRACICPLTPVGAPEPLTSHTKPQAKALLEAGAPER